jgi:predicted kinase
MNRLNKIKTIWVLYGIPASGKDTWARLEMDRNPGKYKRVNKDLLRLMLDNDKFDFKNEKFILKMRDRIVESALNGGYDVILADTNFPIGGRHYKRMCEIAQRVGNVRVIGKFFDVSLKEALKRNTNSDRNPVPEDVIKKMYDKHVKGGSTGCEDLFFQKTEKIPYNKDLPDCVIFDIDGTLAHMNSRRGPFEWDKVDDDDVDTNIKILNNILNSYKNYWEKYLNVYGKSLNEGLNDIKIFIFTGRDGFAKERTKDWLEYNEIYYDKLHIKGENDNRKDTIVKKEMYDENIKDKYNVICIFDDRDQIVQMWRDMGLTVCQVANGDF